MGKTYESARLSKTDMDATREIPVLQREGKPFSGYHGGAGETAMVELLRMAFFKRKDSIVVIDEIETSFHPRVQRRLIRSLASLCRESESQVILTTHSPYVLQELPAEARIYLMDGSEGKQVVKGVSPEFAMSKMDEDLHPEADIYVEDDRARDFLNEILIARDKDLVSRIQVIPFGAASVGLALGQMIGRFPRPSLVFLDGDQQPGLGCGLLPGSDAPERVVFEALKEIQWKGLDERVGRPIAQVIDACSSAMATADHHDWIGYAANRLTLGSNHLWQAMCAVWANDCASAEELQAVSDAVKLKLSA